MIIMGINVYKKILLFIIVRPELNQSTLYSIVFKFMAHANSLPSHIRPLKTGGATDSPT